MENDFAEEIHVSGLIQAQDLLAELCNQLKHLQRSQSELWTAAEDPDISVDDKQTFLEAIQDNKLIIQRKVQLVLATSEHLRKMDPTFSLENNVNWKSFQSDFIDRVDEIPRSSPPEKGLYL